MKKITKILFAFLICFCLINHVSAQEGYITAKGGLAVRSGTNTSSSVIERMPSGVRFTILEKTDSTSNCGTNWYKISFYGGTGYVCGSYIGIYEFPDNIDDDFEETLNQFPESYRKYLIALHEKYPNAKFVAKNSSLNWNDILTNEADSLGKSLIQITDGNHDGWKHINSYDANTGTFNTNYSGGGANWYAASKDIVAYYIDPRNFLNDVFIFMFESNAYDSNIQNEDGVKNLISGTFMDSSNINFNTYSLADDISYENAIMQAAEKSGISPYVLAARIKQEIGVNGNTIISGTVPGYEGYYNYYNIGATGSSDAATIIANGLNYAKARGWNTRLSAIIGGAQIIGSNYKGTQYTQKWDLIDAPYYSMQYMQNIQAPATETVSVYDTYDANGSLQSNFTFEIPVFQNMPDNPAEMPSNSTQVNYLSDLKINGTTISGFSSYIEEYTYYVSKNTEAVKLDATVKDSTSSITGLGNFTLTDDTTIAEIKVTSQSGSTRSYKITIIKSVDVQVTASDIVNQLDLKNDGSYISGINNDITTDSVKNKVKEINSSATVKITDKDGNEKNGNFSTGDRIIISINDTTVSEDVIIYGDVNGDSSISILDLLYIQKHLLNSISLNGAYLKASDINKDGSVTILDLLYVQKYLLGSYTITQ